MKANFKPMGMAAAVAAASVAYAGVASAAIDAGHQGDLAIIPYYTTEAGYVTGVHITNNSDMTQVVKLRLRRGSDSMDALDFNLIMSPYDVWTGTVRLEDDGNILFRTADNTCTAPAPNDPDGFLMPAPEAGTTVINFREGAEEGYIEVIGMGQADANQPITAAAEHEQIGGPGAEPADCRAVRSNFFRNATGYAPADLADNGVISSSVTHQNTYDAETGAITGVTPNTFTSTDNVLSVSYFIRDSESGLEMGSRAVHVADFSQDAMMSNQESFDPQSPDMFAYFYPDLDGGSPFDTDRGLYDSVIRDQLGVEAVLNDWSVNANLNVQTDWVVTLPGQYLMLHRDKYISSLATAGTEDAVLCDNVPATGDTSCDFRDIPVVASIEVWDREEQQTIVTEPEDELVVSPSVNIDPETPAILLPYEVNVIKWFGPDTEDEAGALSSEYSGYIDVGSLGVSGWAKLSIASDPDKARTAGGNGYRVCSQELPLAIDADLTPPSQAMVDAACTDVSNPEVPMVGFVAWKRSFPDRPDGNYGRIIDHSWTTASSAL